VQLLLLHPDVAFRDCEDCKKWIYNEETGEIETKGDQKVPRPKGIKPPCGYKTKGCPKGTPEDSKALTEQNWLAYRFIQECKAVGDFPDDTIVRRNAYLVAHAESTVDRLKRDSLIEWIKTLSQMALQR